MFPIETNKLNEERALEFQQEQGWREEGAGFICLPLVDLDGRCTVEEGMFWVGLYFVVQEHDQG
ncbi:hypothetical protein MAPG_02394 [Magnaporthiopsis poae ATCC 64411]|uniref:Uncharacterized protein n=1 Tax=Magnaporthiopsis poae (strain ATCC 64411 / 73-15) TaxID=644358 RepID=A0A0C4DR88_MAGP6|nr:hypothetical protein MAPG_02394 [Magnaporthiopsis poae ATCC 64411]